MQRRWPVKLAKPRRVELAAATVMVILLVAAAVCLTGSRPISWGRWTLGGGEEEALAQPGEWDSQGQGSSDGRVKLISQSITGTLEPGTLEDVVEQVEALILEARGHVSRETLTFGGGGLWRGDMELRVPTENVTDFVFAVRALISLNGRVEAITVEVRDVTGTPLEGEAAYATLRLTLREVESRRITASSIAAAVSPVLSSAFTWVIAGVAIIVPLSFTALGLVLLTTRAILPVWQRALRKPTPVEGPTRDRSPSTGL